MTGVPQRALFRDGAGLALAQAIAVVAFLGGTRWITTRMSPEAFGQAAVLMGLAALGLGTAASPLLQAGLRFYPEAERAGQVLAFRRTLYRLILYRSAWVVFALLGAGIVVHLGGWGHWEWFLLVAGILLLDAYRGLQVSLLNAARRQGQVALWTGVDPILRMVGGALAVTVYSQTVAGLLAGFLGGATLAAVVLRGITRWSEAESGPCDPTVWREQLRRYSTPLIPMALFGWAGGLLDRYLIFGLLGAGAAGVYAAAYGLASRPFLLTQGILEQTYRPHVMKALSDVGWVAARRDWSRWMAWQVTLHVLGLGLLVVASRPLVRLLLGPEYSAAALLLPWIAAGYLLLSLSYGYDRILLMMDRTRMLLGFQLLGTAVMAAVTWLAASRWGLQGAAVAVPVYFGVQLLISMSGAWLALREYGRGRAAGPVPSQE